MILGWQSCIYSIKETFLKDMLKRLRGISPGRSISKSNISKTNGIGGLAMGAGVGMGMSIGALAISSTMHSFDKDSSGYYMCGSKAATRTIFTVKDKIQYVCDCSDVPLVNTHIKAGFDSVSIIYQNHARISAKSSQMIRATLEFCAVLVMSRKQKLNYPSQSQATRTPTLHAAKPGSIANSIFSSYSSTTAMLAYLMNIAKNAMSKLDQEKNGQLNLKIMTMIQVPIIIKTVIMMIVKWMNNDTIGKCRKK